MQDKYMIIIESLGEVIADRDETIKLQKSEIERLKRKIEMIESYIEFHEEKVTNS